MKLSKETINIIKHFAKINRGFAVEPGNVLRTLAPNMALYAEAVITETFPVEVTLSDAREFLRIVSLFSDPDFDFGPVWISICESDGTARAKYANAEIGSVTPNVGKKRLKVPHEQFALDVSESQWQTLGQALGFGALKKKHRDRWQSKTLIIKSDGESVVVGVHGGLSSGNEEYAVRIDANPQGQECTVVLNADNLFLMSGAYRITVMPTFAQFINTSGYNLVYFVASEPRCSSWGGRREYQVRVGHTCHIAVQARSHEEAEALVRQMQVDDVQFAASARTCAEYKVLP